MNPAAKAVSHTITMSAVSVAGCYEIRDKEVCMEAGNVKRKKGIRRRGEVI